MTTSVVYLIEVREEFGAKWIYYKLTGSDTLFKRAAWAGNKPPPWDVGMLEYGYFMWIFVA